MRPIQNAEDQIVELMLSFRDVSESRQAARAQAQRELQLLKSAETERARSQGALASAEREHASIVEALRRQHADQEASLQGTITALGAKLKSKEEESVAAAARERSTTEGLRQELRELHSRLAAAEKALQDAHRQLDSEAREARSAKEAFERRFQEAGARHAALLQAKQAECDRTAEEGLRALAELDALRKHVVDAKGQAAATLAEARRQFEQELAALETKRREELARNEDDLANARQEAARLAQRLAELGAEHDRVVRMHSDTLASLRQELADETTHRQTVAERGALLANVIEACPHGMLVFDVQRHITCWNAALGKLTGKSAVDLIGQPLPDAFPDPADGSAVQQMTWAHERLGGDGVIGNVSRQGQLQLAGAKLPDGGGMAIVWEQLGARPTPRPTARDLSRDELEWLAYN
jgi:PAS domain-containing protein